MEKIKIFGFILILLGLFMILCSAYAGVHGGIPFQVGMLDGAGTSMACIGFLLRFFGNKLSD